MNLPLCTSEKSMAYSSLSQHITLSFIAIRGLLRLSFFRIDKPRSPSLSLHTMSSGLQPLWWSSDGLIPSLRTRVCLVLWSSKLDTAGHTPRSFFAKLLSSWMDLCLYRWKGLYLLKRRTWHLLLIIFTRFPSAQYFSLHISFKNWPVWCCTEFSWEYTLSHHPMSLIKTLNNTCISPRRTLLVTDCQLDFILLCTILWAQWSKQIFTCFCLLSQSLPRPIYLEINILQWKGKFLLWSFKKSRYNNIKFFFYYFMQSFLTSISNVSGPF